MATVCVWKGHKHYEDGRDLSNYVNVTFDGEALGVMKYGGEERGITYAFYATSNGRVVVHEVIWSDLPHEATLGHVNVFESIEEAAANYRLHMERAGIIERRTLTLEEFLE